MGAIASSTVKTACDIASKAIIVLSETGETARLLAKFHPNTQILAICSSDRVARQIEGYVQRVRGAHGDPARRWRSRAPRLQGGPREGPLRCGRCRHVRTH